MELLTYLIILVVTAISLYIIIFTLLGKALDSESRRLRGILTGLIVVIVVGIVTLVASPYVSYNNCAPIQQNVTASGSYSIFSVKPTTVPVQVLSCERARSAIIITISTVILLTFGIFMILFILELGRLGAVED